MAPRFGIPATLLLFAAVGWVWFPPRPAPQSDLTDLAVRQMRDDGTVAAALHAHHRARVTADTLAPVVCLALTAIAVVAGVRAAYRGPLGD